MPTLSCSSAEAGSGREEEAKTDCPSASSGQVLKASSINLDAGLAAQNLFEELEVLAGDDGPREMFQGTKAAALREVGAKRVVLEKAIESLRPGGAIVFSDRKSVV